MKKLMMNLMATTVLFSAAAIPVQAENTLLMLPIADAMAANDARARLGDSVKFYFADHKPTSKIVKELGSDTVSLRTNAFGKKNETACNWVFLSDMLSLKEEALKRGANAVINIVNNFDHKPNPSATEFECHVGFLMAGVAFKADFVRIAD